MTLLDDVIYTRHTLNQENSLNTLRIIAAALTLPALAFLISLTIQNWESMTIFGKTASVLIMCSVFTLGFLASGVVDMTDLDDRNDLDRDVEAELERNHG